MVRKYLFTNEKKKKDEEKEEGREFYPMHVFGVSGCREKKRKYKHSLISMAHSKH